MKKPTIETAMEFLRYTAGTLRTPLGHITMVMLSTPGWDTAPGASSHHHNYVGGLAEHTAEVVWFAMMLTGFGNSGNTLIDYNVLVAAALWHDYKKLEEYAVQNGKVLKRPYMALIGHPVGSALAFREAYIAADGGMTPTAEAIFHCILAHHGRREWGAPVEPKLPEAYILHAADMLSAQPLMPEVV